MKFIYLLGGFFFILIPLITMNNDFEYYRVEKQGNIVEMKITRISGACLGTKIPYFMELEYLHKKYMKRIGGAFCQEHSVGDKINMKYLQDSEKIMFPKESQLSEFISGGIMLIGGILLILLFFFKTFK